MEFTQNQIEHLLKNAELKQSDVAVKLLEDKENEKHILSLIKKCLQNSSEQEFALKLLSDTLYYLSNEVVQENIVSWVEVVLDRINSNPSHMQFLFLGIVVEYSARNADYNKTRMVLLIPTIIIKCLNVEKFVDFEKNALTCLKNCFKYYPSASGHLKDKSIKFLTKYFDHNDDSFIIDSAAECYHLLQGCGQAGVDSSHHIQNWKETINKLCQTIESQHEEIFNQSSIEDCVKIQNKLRCSCRFLKIMIEKKSSHPKVLKPQIFVDLLETFLVFKHEHNNSLVSWYMNYFYKQHILDILRIFRSFMVLIGHSIIPFSRRIMKLLTDTLYETRSGNFKFNSEYKCALYQLIGWCFQLMGNHIDEKCLDKILLTIIDDITPITTTMTLVTPSNTKGSKRKAGNQKQTTESDGCTKGCYEDIKEEVAYSALNCLIKFFKHFYGNVKDNLLRTTYKTLFTVISSLQSGKTVPPYRNEALHCKLYETLASTIEQFSPPLVEMLLNIFTIGENSDVHKISLICREAIINIEKICQPTGPPLLNLLSASIESHEQMTNFKVEISDVSNETDLITSTENQMETDVEKVDTSSEIDTSVKIKQSADASCKIPLTAQVEEIKGAHYHNSIKINKLLENDGERKKNDSNDKKDDQYNGKRDNDGNEINKDIENNIDARESDKTASDLSSPVQESVSERIDEIPTKRLKTNVDSKESIDLEKMLTTFKDVVT